MGRILGPLSFALLMLLSYFVFVFLKDCSRKSFEVVITSPSNMFEVRNYFERSNRFNFLSYPGPKAFQQDDRSNYTTKYGSGTKITEQRKTHIFKSSLIDWGCMANLNCGAFLLEKHNICNIFVQSWMRVSSSRSKPMGFCFLYELNLLTYLILVKFSNRNNKRIGLETADFFFCSWLAYKTVHVRKYLAPNFGKKIKSSSTIIASYLASPLFDF